MLDTAPAGCSPPKSDPCSSAPRRYRIGVWARTSEAWFRMKSRSSSPIEVSRTQIVNQYAGWSSGGLGNARASLATAAHVAGCDEATPRTETVRNVSDTSRLCRRAVATPRLRYELCTTSCVIQPTVIFFPGAVAEMVPASITMRLLLLCCPTYNAQNPTSSQMPAQSAHPRHGTSRGQCAPGRRG